jgi:hypothetical protein
MRKQMPTYNQTELAMTSHTSIPVGNINTGIAIIARKRQSSDIVTSAGMSNGTLRIKPAAENAKTPQLNIKLATTIVPRGANKVPCRADSIIGCGARANANQVGPPIIQTKCQIAAHEAITPALINNVD